MVIAEYKHRHDLSSVCFISQDVGYAVGRKGKIIKTSDGGTSWDTLSSGISYDLNYIISSMPAMAMLSAMRALYLKQQMQGEPGQLHIPALPMPIIPAFYRSR